jgi:hypothetical protein
MSPTRAWAGLLVLSALSTMAASLPQGALVAVGVLALAWLKAQVILWAYLRLSQAPDIARGFALVLGLVLAAYAGLAVAPGLLAG